MSMEDVNNNFTSCDNIFLSQYIVEIVILSPYCWCVKVGLVLTRLLTLQRIIWAIASTGSENPNLCNHFQRTTNLKIALVQNAMVIY